LQDSVRFTGSAYLLHLVPAHVFARSNASKVRHMIMRNVPISTSTAAVRFPAPDPDGCHVTWQYLNGWI
jgi:hypothetical protein